MAVADRLLRSSAARFYDPDVDVDWSAPPVEGLDYILDHRCSLYGTPLWAKLTPEQRRELGKHEAASVASVGLWFELILMRMLVKLAYEGDPTDPRIQYALTETAEESGTRSCSRRWSRPWAARRTGRARTSTGSAGSCRR